MSHIRLLHIASFFLISLLIDNSEQQSNVCRNATDYPIGFGDVFSSNFPDPYGNNVDCAYYLQSDVGSLLSIAFDQFDTETCCDHLTIFDGPTMTSPIIVKLVI